MHGSALATLNLVLKVLLGLCCLRIKAKHGGFPIKSGMKHRGYVIDVPYFFNAFLRRNVRMKADDFHIPGSIGSLIFFREEAAMK